MRELVLREGEGWEGGMVHEEGERKAGREGMSEVLSAYKSISRVTHIANRNNTYCQ